MKKIACFVFILIALSCQREIEDRKFTIEKFNWTIVVPEGFEYMPEYEQRRIKQKGLDVLEKELGEEIDDQTEKIFTIRNGRFNVFEANYQPFDEAVDGNYEEFWSDLKKLMYDAFISQMPEIKLDTISSHEKIDGLDFQLYHMKVSYPNDMVLQVYFFGHLFDKEDFSSTITFVDEELGKKMLKSFRESKFGKN